MNKEKKFEKGVIDFLINSLNGAKISYAVLRNYEKLPQKPLAGSDIDLLIGERSQKEYISIFKKAIQDSGTLILSKSRHFNCLSYFVYQKTPFRFLNWIDAFTKITTKSFVWMDSDFLLKNRVWHKNGFYVLSPGAEAANLFLKEVLAGFKVKEKYRSRIQDLVKRDENTFFQTISVYFSQKIAQEMLQICFEGRWEDVFKKRRQLWQKLFFTAFSRQPIKQLFWSLRFLWDYFWELVRFRKGISIAFIGPDGVGKTTICQGFQKRLEKFPFKKIFYYHGRFEFFPQLGKLYNRLIAGGEGIKDKDILTSKKVGNLRALLYLAYYGLEYFLGWPWFLWAKIRGYIFIFDRYFYDFFANERFPKLFLFISKIIPRPDLLFAINAKPELIYERKKELTIDEIKNQLKVFQGPLLEFTKPIKIENEGSLEIILDEIEKELFKIIS